MNIEYVNIIFFFKYINVTLIAISIYSRKCLRIKNAFILKSFEIN